MSNNSWVSTDRERHASRHLFPRPERPTDDRARPPAHGGSLAGIVKGRRIGDREVIFLFPPLPLPRLRARAATQDARLGNPASHPDPVELRAPAFRPDEAVETERLMPIQPN